MKITEGLVFYTGQVNSEPIWMLTHALSMGLACSGSFVCSGVSCYEYSASDWESLGNFLKLGFYLFLFSFLTINLTI